MARMTKDDQVTLFILGVFHQGTSRVTLNMFAYKADSLFLGKGGGVLTNFSEESFTRVALFLNFRDGLGIVRQRTLRP